MDPEEKIKELGITLPPSPKPIANYLPYTKAGNLVFISGMLAVKDGELLYKGKVGEELSLEEAKKAAEIACLNAISALRDAAVALGRVKRILKLTCYVASSHNFNEQHIVANAASELLFKIFGEKGRHAREAVGVASLPKNACVEISLIAEVEE